MIWYTLNSMMTIVEFPDEAYLPEFSTKRTTFINFIYIYFINYEHFIQTKCNSNIRAVIQDFTT